MRRIAGGLWILAVAALVLYLLPPVIVGVIGGIWDLAGGEALGSSDVEVPVFFSIAAVAAGGLGFMLAWVAARLGRAPLVLWLGVVLGTGFLIGGLGFGSQAGPGPVAGAVGVIVTASGAAFLGGRLGQWRRLRYHGGVADPRR